MLLWIMSQVIKGQFCPNFFKKKTPFLEGAV